MLQAPVKKPARAPRFAGWLLLNPYTARHASLLSLGAVGFRPLPEARETLGYSLAFGEVITTLRGPLTTGLVEESELRLVPRDALSLSLRRYQWEAGLRIGPLEPTARVGFTLAHLDVGHGFSFGLLSPRVGVGLWWKLSHSRVGVSAFTEYFWRWVGSDSAFVHGFTLELQPDSAPLLERTTSSLSDPTRP